MYVDIKKGLKSYNKEKKRNTYASSLDLRAVYTSCITTVIIAYYPVRYIDTHAASTFIIKVIHVYTNIQMYISSLCSRAMYTAHTGHAKINVNFLYRSYSYLSISTKSKAHMEPIYVEYNNVSCYFLL